MSNTEKALRMVEEFISIEIKTKKYADPLQEEEYIDFLARVKKVVRHQIAANS